MTNSKFFARRSLIDKLNELGFTNDEAIKLIRIERVLHRWSELECGDKFGRAIERDNETSKPFLTYEIYGQVKRGRQAIPDREAGALKRLTKIIDVRNKREFHPVIPETVSYFYQSDPRGCALYVYKVADLKGTKINSVYNSIGVAVCD